MNYKSLILITCLFVSTVWTRSSCNNGLTKCYSKCANLHSDKANCGKCGHKCKSSQTCSRGKCASQCSPGSHRNSARQCVCTAGSPHLSSFRQKVFVDFENPSYNLGTPNNQHGWKSAGSAGPSCAGSPYDHAIDTSTAIGFKDKSLRISNAVVSGCFGDQTFAPPISGSVGEADATTTADFPATPRMKHFEMQFDIRSTVPAAQQAGLFVSVSPDRGDGSRMSYLGFEDKAGGIDVIFFEVTGTGTPANFVQSTVATNLDRTKSHRIRLTLDVVDGPSNDVVKVYINCKLVKKGTSWENYYRYDAESVAEQSPRVVKTILFRTSGTAHPEHLGKGFLFDNVFIGAK